MYLHGLEVNKINICKYLGFPLSLKTKVRFYLIISILPSSLILNTPNIESWTNQLFQLFHLLLIHFSKLNSEKKNCCESTSQARIHYQVLIRNVKPEMLDSVGLTTSHLTYLKLFALGFCQQLTFIRQLQSSSKYTGQWDNSH